MRDLAFLMLIALLGYNCGCTKAVKLTAEEVDSAKPTKVREVSPVYDIKTVVLDTSGTIEFDDEGARYDANTGLIEGTDILGSQVSVRLDECRTVQWSENALTCFDSKGGWLGFGASHIVGETEDGRQVKIPVEDVLYVKTRRFALFESIFFVGVPVFVIAFSLFSSDLDVSSGGN